MSRTGSFTRNLCKAAALLALMAGCKDSATKPRSPTPDPTLQNIWPNENGRAWTFDLVQRSWQPDPIVIYLAPVQVPAAPTLDRLALLLGGHAIGDSPLLESGSYHLLFDGTITTPSGAQGQNLRAEIVTRRPDKLAGRPSPNARFFRRLAAARPDLAPRIRALQPEQTSAADSVDLPLILHGNAWRKTADWIGTFGSLDTLLAWKYLQRDLSPGSTFTHQLVPSLANDVFLKARVLRQFEVETAVGKLEKAIEVLYLVDYGRATAIDQFGQIVGYFRFYDYGTIVYAPTVGPVSSYERSFVESGDPPTPGVGDETLRLIGTGLAVP